MTVIQPNTGVAAAQAPRLRIFDAHHHFWDTRINHYPWLCGAQLANFRYGNYDAIRGPYLPADYLIDTARYDVAGSVYIEAEWDPTDPLGEMRYIEMLRGRRDIAVQTSVDAMAGGDRAIADHGRALATRVYPTVAVGQAWLDSPSVQATLEGLSEFAFVRGIRHKPRANPAPGDTAPGGMTDPAWRSGFSLLARHGLHFELQTPWWHLREAAELARDFPGTRIILNHTGLPADRSAAGLAAWRAAMAELASCPNASVKISGLGQLGMRWTVQANRPVVLAAIDLFGVERCMFASNFPVDGLCASFDEIFDGFGEIVAAFSPDEQRRLFHDNAVRHYAPGG
jgi:predicted TIM-barrel fold metal-dependent hydrolase